MQAFCSVFKYVVREPYHPNETETKLKSKPNQTKPQRDENGQDKLVCDDFCYSSSTLLDTEEECNNATLCKGVNNVAADADCLYAETTHTQHTIRTHTHTLRATGGTRWRKCACCGTRAPTRIA
jgi:hypothetical protein